MDICDQFIVSVAAVIWRKDRLLIMKRSDNKKAAPGLWETLSGRVEHSEEPYAAICREIMEECALEVDVEPLPVDLYMTSRLGLPMLLLIYRAHYLSKEVTLSDEHSEYQWATIEEFRQKSPLKRLVLAAERSQLFGKNAS